jgi:hypothetical protein
MTSRLWSTLVSGSVLTLALAVGGRAQAQVFGFNGIGGYPSVNQPGPGYGAGINFGATPFGYGSFGGADIVGLGSFGGFPVPLSYGLSSAHHRPMTTISFQPVWSAITAVPGWDGSVHRIHRRHR